MVLGCQMAQHKSTIRELVEESQVQQACPSIHPARPHYPPRRQASYIMRGHLCNALLVADAVWLIQVEILELRESARASRESSRAATPSRERPGVPDEPSGFMTVSSLEQSCTVSSIVSRMVSSIHSGERGEQHSEQRGEQHNEQHSV